MNNYFEFAKKCARKKGVWKLAAVVFFIAFVGMSVAAIMLKIKNDKYRDKLIEVSEQIPNTPEQEEELADIRRREWSRANAPSNRMSDEERIAENRVTEEA